MTIEKAFAIEAPASKIWDALVGELSTADKSAYRVERAITNEELSLWVHLAGGIQARLTYRLISRESHTEVIASMEPQGFRYQVFRIITLGRADVNYEMVLVEGLANLKSAAES
jgi:hypothetical protein